MGRVPRVMMVNHGQVSTTGQPPAYGDIDDNALRR